MLYRTTGLLRILSTALLILVSVALAANGQNRQDRKVSKDDTNFMTMAAEAGLKEVQLGKVAEEKGSSAQVKDYGRHMQKDHSKANQELQKLAANKGVKLPTELKGKHKSAVDRLSKLSGEEFDREYMQAMVEDHKETLGKFERQADKADDADVKKFASDQVPVLKKHLELAQTTQQQVTAGRGTGKTR